jgi:hypothetical protein
MKLRKRKNTVRTATALAALLVAGAPVLSALAAEDKWKGEVSPYVWMAGINGDATVRGQNVNVDYSFSDILDATDAAGSVLAVLQYGQVVFWGQLDYLSLDSDQLENPPVPGRLESETTITTLAIGYQFLGSAGKTYDLMLGTRKVSMDNTLTLNALSGSPFRGERDISDTVIVFRPSIPLSEKWRFNPTLSYGSGDSEKTYEL